MNNLVLENSYVRGLAIYDHLQECVIIADEIKRLKNHKSVDPKEMNLGLSEEIFNLQEHYENELTDLFILLQKEVDIDRFIARLNKFKEKANEESLRRGD